jgi:1-acyl-sn-glycerol-3-phosphate acyltransferase
VTSLDSVFRNALRHGATLSRLASLLGPRPRGNRTQAEQARELSELCGRVCELHGWQREVVGRFPEGPSVLVANHQSYVDPVVICAAFPCLPIAKSEVAAWPFIGRASRELGVKFTERGKARSGARSLCEVMATLSAGTSVLNFPEGTTTRGALNPFASGIFGVARRGKVPVVPVFIHLDQDMPWVGDDAFVPHYARLLCRSVFVRPRCQIRIEVGPSLASDAFGNPKQLADAAREWIASRQRAFQSHAAPILAAPARGAQPAVSSV